MIHVPSNVNNNIGTNKITFPQNFIMISCSLREQVVWNQPQVLAPNVGPWGNEYHHDSIRQAVDHVDQCLRDPELGLHVKRGFVAFTPETIHANSLREGHHQLWVCLSLARKPDSTEFRSLWTKSDLVKRAIVYNAPMASTTSYYDPTKGTFGRADTDGSDISKKQQARMALSGHGLVGAIRKQLFSGMGLTPAHKAAWIDTTPYFIDGPEAIMLAGSSSKEPTEMWILPVSSDLGVQGGTSEYINDNICKHFKFHLKRKMLELGKKLAFKIPGLQAAALVAAPLGQRPAYNIEEFKCVFPSGPPHLPLRANWLKELDEVITAPSVQQEMSEVLKTHNTEWNPSCKPWTDDSKRAAETEAGGSQKIAKTIPEDQNAPKEEKDLGDHVKIPHEGQDLFITETGQLWCHGLKDDMLTTDGPMALVFGEFLIDGPATTLIDTLKPEDTHTMVFNLATEGSLTSFEMPKGDNAANFSEAPSTIEAACQYVERGNFDVPDMFALHHVTPKTVKDGEKETVGRTYEVKNKTPCVFIARKSPRIKKQVDSEDAGSMLILGHGNTAEERLHATSMQKKKWKKTAGLIMIHELGHIMAVMRMGQHGNLFFKIAPSLREIDKANLSRNPDSIMLMP